MNATEQNKHGTQYPGQLAFSDPFGSCRVFLVLVFSGSLSMKYALSENAGWREQMRFIVNGSVIESEFDPRTSLLDLLRDHLHLAGSKKGCNQGACGACTVLVDDERILACLALAVQYEGRSITTIEGLASENELHPLQQAFIQHDGFQCGYCTPGQICSAVGMVQELRRGVPSNVTGDLSADHLSLSHDELRERMSGNLCRCGAYNGIVEAIGSVYGEVQQ